MTEFQDGNTSVSYLLTSSRNNSKRVNYLMIPRLVLNKWNLRLCSMQNRSPFSLEQFISTSSPPAPCSMGSMSAEIKNNIS
jgi:hypothetical protein